MDVGIEGAVECGGEGCACWPAGLKLAPVHTGQNRAGIGIDRVGERQEPLEISQTAPQKVLGVREFLLNLHDDVAVELAEKAAGLFRLELIDNRRGAASLKKMEEGHPGPSVDAVLVALGRLDGGCYLSAVPFARLALPLTYEPVPTSLCS